MWTKTMLALTAWLLAAPLPAATVEGMITLEVRGRQIEGVPLAWDAKVLHLLGRDGRLWSITPDEATNYRQTASRFLPYSVSEIRAQLLRELGDGYEVTGAKHYMVAHPRGQRDAWAARLEDFYGDFVHYFSVRGFTLSEPPFPLIAVVCRNQDDFVRYTSQQGRPAARGVLGYYSLTSNRIMLFDAGSAGSDAKRWQQNAETVIHEATHQLAFNTGIQSRYCPPPTWAVEGLALLFEARGVYNSRDYPDRADRINRQRLGDYRTLVAKGAQQQLPRELTASDQLFDSHPAVAYAESWALMFYLVEAQPRELARYLARCAERPPLTDYTAPERLADFTAVFGDNWRMLDARLTRFLDGL